ncbi:DHS-like NAD/FAD-binding domain-containing protein [Cenococcum geophilum]
MPKIGTSGYNTSLPARKRGMAEIQLNRLLNVLHKKRRIIILVGAGISVSAGILDFQSIARLFNTPGNGPFWISLGKDLFNASMYYNDVSTSSFHDIARSAKLTTFYYLLATLAHDGRLLRLYSQNINGINTAMEPLRTEDNNKFCVKAGKWSHGNPNDEVIGSVIVSNLRVRLDAFIVTSITLKVLGARRIVREMCRLVRDQVGGVTIWISKEAAPKVVRGSCDEVAQYAVMRRWDQELEYSETKYGNAKVRSVLLESVEVPKHKQRQLLLSPLSLKIPQKVTKSKKRNPKVSTGSDTLKVRKVVRKWQV